jgi:phage terminase large subunit
MYADASEPARIQEIEEAGYNIFPAEKGQGSVGAGISYCQALKTHVHPESTNIISEKQSYKWREDRNGVPLDEPVKFKDHAQDAERYAIFTHKVGAPLLIAAAVGPERETTHMDW